jgi:hypothetical protein
VIDWPRVRRLLRAGRFGFLQCSQILDGQFSTVCHTEPCNRLPDESLVLDGNETSIRAMCGRMRTQLSAADDAEFIERVKVFTHELQHITSDGLTACR